jgi:glycosyltransferase involved in cell wall biosynthesis
MSPRLDSVVVPVYRNAATIDELIAAIATIAASVEGELEAIFVIDGSPDDSRARLLSRLEGAPFRSRVVDHTRNFGSFAAIRTGMSLARGEAVAVMAADLQEPPELVIEFLRRLATGEVDVVAGERASRNDPGDSASGLYWRLYRRFVMEEMPSNGVDVFACTAQVRDVLCSLEDTNTSLVAQLFWVGFRRELVPYDRRPREGESGWTLHRKLRYLSDSVFAFTDLPVRILWTVGVLAIGFGALLAVVVAVTRLTGAIDVPGYAATILVVVFFAGVNCLGLGIIGSYIWRAYEAVKGRPGAIVRDVVEVSPEQARAPRVPEGIDA